MILKYLECRTVSRMKVEVLIRITSLRFTGPWHGIDVAVSILVPYFDMNSDVFVWHSSFSSVGRVLSRTSRGTICKQTNCNTAERYVFIIDIQNDYVVHLEISSLTYLR